MTGRTAYQKIVDAHVVRILEDGRQVLRVDRVWGHEITTPNAILDAQARGCDVVFDPNRIKMMIDHVNPAKDTASAVQGKVLRDWCKKHDIEFLDVGRNGVCHAIIPEMRWIKPGQIGIMGDSHTCTHGAFCALAAGVGTTELEAGIITGLWVCAPQKVMRVNYTGILPANVFPKDLILTLIGRIGVKGATNSIIEFGGEVIDRMSMEGRMTLTNMVVEAGATSGMMDVDRTTFLYNLPEGHGFAIEETEGGFMDHAMQWNSDPDAEYDEVINIHVSGFIPVMTANYSPDDIMTVRGLEGRRVDQVYIGSCTNGRIEDLRVAARVFERAAKPVASHCRCIIVPATQAIFNQAMREGLIETFTKAGCHVTGPTCGACLGMSCGVLAPDEVCVSTTNRNFQGRMGKGGMVHLASPATAATCAINGEITEPEADDFDVAQSEQPPITNIIGATEWPVQPVAEIDYTSLAERQIAGGLCFSGNVFYLGNPNVDTDQIIPAKYLTETKKEIFGEHCLENVVTSAEDRSRFKTSQILVTRENFGCGSSREHAVWALEAMGIRCVIAPSFARIFYNNMFANGLLCIELPKESIDQLFKESASKADVNWRGGVVSFTKNAESAELNFGLTNHQRDLIMSGGSIGVMLKLAAEIQQSKIGS